MAWKDYLPDFKEALNGFYDERLKEVIESKSGEYKTLTTDFIQKSLNYQKALLVIALAVFLLLAIAYFWN